MVEVDGRSLVTDWRELLGLHARTWGTLERELHDRHCLGASEFEVLDRLLECPKNYARVQELADAVHLSQSALSRLISRLEKAGLISRTMCGDDRRGIFVCLTPEGEAKHAEALPTHRAILAKFLNDAEDQPGD